MRIAPASAHQKEDSLSTYIELRLLGLMADPIARMPLLVLRDSISDRKIAMWVGGFEAYAISGELERVTNPRPMTHDLLKNVLDAFSARLDKLTIEDVEDGIFYAKLHLSTPNGPIEIDCRPSDGIALALKCDAGIFATESAITKAQNVDLTAGHRDSEKIRSWIASLGQAELGAYEQ